MSLPRCETSKIPARSRTAVCSATVPAGYEIGMSHPANTPILAPRARCWASSGDSFSMRATLGRGAHAVKEKEGSGEDASEGAADLDDEGRRLLGPASAHDPVVVPEHGPRPPQVGELVHDERVAVPLDE